MCLDHLPNLLAGSVCDTSEPNLTRVKLATKPNLIKAFSVYFQLFRQKFGYILSAGFADCARGTNISHPQINITK